MSATYTQAQIPASVTKTTTETTSNTTTYIGLFLIWVYVTIVFLIAWYTATQIDKLRKTLAPGGVTTATAVTTTSGTTTTVITLDDANWLYNLNVGIAVFSIIVWLIIIFYAIYLAYSSSSTDTVVQAPVVPAVVPVPAAALTNQIPTRVEYIPVSQSQSGNQIVHTRETVTRAGPTRPTPSTVYSNGAGYPQDTLYRQSIVQ